MIAIQWVVLGYTRLQQQWTGKIRLQTEKVRMQTEKVRMLTKKSADSELVDALFRYVTTIGATTWYNLTYAASLPDIPVHGGHVQLNPFHSFSATCTYYAVCGVTIST